MAKTVTDVRVRRGAYVAWTVLLLVVATGIWPRAYGAAESLSSSEATGQGLDVAGNHLLLDGAPFLPHGFNMIGVLAPDWCTTGQGPAARNHLGQAEMDAATAWDADMVRFQVSQRGLADPTIDQAQRDAYLQRIVAAVDLARSNGFVVDLSMQDQANGCGDTRPLPSAETVAAWDVLAPTFAGNPYVMFELYNEPNQDNTAAGWVQWRDGGSSPNANLGEPAVGYQALVDQVRQLGASNVLVADGLNLAERLSGVPLLADPGNRLMYGVHPYNFAAGVASWDQQFGDLTATAPVIATEWNYTAKRCGTTSESVAPALLDYLKAHDIGVLAHALDVPGATVADWTWAATGCGTTVGGSGQLTRQYFADLQGLEQVALTAPQNLTAAAHGTSQVALAWSAVTGLGVTYDVVRDGVIIATTPDPSYVDASVAPGQTYTYTVSARRSTGAEGPTAEPVSVTVPDGTDVTPPSTPTAVTASAPTAAAVDLTWQASSDDVGVTDYIVERDGVEIAETGGTTWTDTAVQPTTAYSYTVAAEDATGNRSPFSSAVTVTTPAPPDTSPPSAPTHVSGRLLSPTSAVLTWTASTDDVGVSGYRISRNGVVIATVVSSRKPSYTDMAMPSGRTNSYIVSAFDAAGNDSLASSPAIVIAPAQAANGLTATYFGTTSLTDPRLTRTDNSIAFAWGTAAPAGGVPADKFSVRWTGEVIPPTSQTYTFHALSDNGMRVWVNGTLVVSDWTSHALRERTGTITLKSNQAYTLKVEYYENTNNATARLLWSTPTIAEQVVPTAQLLVR